MVFPQRFVQAGVVDLSAEEVLLFQTSLLLVQGVQVLEAGVLLLQDLDTVSRLLAALLSLDILETIEQVLFFREKTSLDLFIEVGVETSNVGVEVQSLPGNALFTLTQTERLVLVLAVEMNDVVFDGLVAFLVLALGVLHDLLFVGDGLAVGSDG